MFVSCLVKGNGLFWNIKMVAQKVNVRQVSPAVVSVGGGQVL
jgi:hypothetical protein